METIYDTAIAIVRGTVEWAVVPIENSLDGSVTVTLDLLADNAAELQIIAETLLPVRHCLAASTDMPLTEIRTVLTHPQVPGQCRELLRGALFKATVVPATSTADAVAQAAASDPGERLAAIGTQLAAEIYGAAVLRQDVQDRDDNLTRFVWLGGRRAAGKPPLRALPAPLTHKTSLVFWGPGADRAGWLVRCLDEFSSRNINLTKIESRPRRERMGHYMFFVDLEGEQGSPEVAAALDGLHALCEQVRVLGSYPTL